MSTTLATATDLAGILAPAERWLVVVDFDGTLSPIVDQPDAARPAAGAVEVLARLSRHTPVVVLSGRPVDELRDRLGTLSVTLAGGHGAEIVTADGQRTRLVDPAVVGHTLDAAADEVAALTAPDDGWIIEAKGTSLAVHHRLVDPTISDALLPRVRAVMETHAAAPPGFEVMAGKAVLELRVRGVDKGAALRTIADRAPRLEPLVIGDDVTDEDAFREADARGGIGILVAAEPRTTAATWRLAGPDEVVALLGALADSATEEE